MEKLTKVQQIVLTYIKTYISEVGYSPVEEEVQRHMGYASKNSARELLKIIKRKGYINTTPNVARSIVLVTGSTVDNWISVNDELPLSVKDAKKYESVQVIVKYMEDYEGENGNGVGVEFYTVGDKPRPWGYWSEHKNVTHWQLLPSI